MTTFTNRRCPVVPVLLLLLSLGGMLSAVPADAAVYRWDNGALITDLPVGALAESVGMDLSYADLVGAPLGHAEMEDCNFAQAHLMNANLGDGRFVNVNWTGANLSGANLSDSSFGRNTFTNADLSGAFVGETRFDDTTDSGFTAAQLYSTASYQNDDLDEIGLGHNDLSGWDFAGMDLTYVDFGDATLTDTDFSGAFVDGATFHGTTDSGFTAAQLYSTASYQNDDLGDIRLAQNDLSGWDFAGITFADATFSGSNLTDSDFSGATLLETYFSGANLTNADLSGADLTTTNCDRANLTAANLSGANLSYVDFDDANLTTADFSKANLTDADFEDSTLTDANFSGAIVIGAEFGDATNGGFTAAQLYSTASYQAGDLRRIGLDGSDLTGWNFAGKNLTDARFYYANLTNANLSGANLTGTGFSHANLTDADLGGATLTDAGLSYCDLRGATILPAQISSAADTEDAILPDGRIEGLALDAGERLVVRDHELPITVESGMSLDPTQQTRMIFEDDDWGSTISFEPGIEVSLDGALSLILADDVRPADLIGTTFDLFDWDGAIVTGQFDRIGGEPGVIWDTSRLYSTGQVTLVPEHSTFLLLLIAMMGYVLRHRKSAARKQLLESLESSS